METDSADCMLDSPTTSRAIDMMDLDPNMMDEPYDSGFLQSSAPIPIRFEIRFYISPKIYTFYNIFYNYKC